MLCAVCKSRLDSVELHDLTIDQCSFCQALWFDRGEIEKYSEDHEPLDFVEGFNGPIFRANRSSPRRDCPRCESPSLQFGTLSNYDVWRCESCRGFFVFSETIDVLAPNDRAADAFAPLELLLSLLAFGIR